MRSVFRRLRDEYHPETTGISLTRWCLDVFVTDQRFGAGITIVQVYVILASDKCGTVLLPHLCGPRNTLLYCSLHLILPTADRQYTPYSVERSFVQGCSLV